jgi:hypothetical protein
MHVLHRCDVFCCVNPDHLFLGTGADNVADKVKKDRQAKGTDSPSAKLTENDVREIRLLEGKISNRAIGRLYGVSHGRIGNIFHGKSWKHV